MRTLFKRLLFVIMFFLTFTCGVRVFAANTYFVWEKTVIDVPLNSSIKSYEDDYKLSFYVNGVKSDDYIVEKEVNCSTFSTVLTHIIGKYTVYYKAYSKNNNISSTQAIIFNVVDVTPPTILLNKEVILEYGEKIDVKDYFNISDNYCSGDEISYVIDDSYVLYNMLGKYRASIIVFDKFNNTNKVDFEVKIVDNTKPEIFVLKPLIFSYKEEVDVLEYFKVVDNYDSDITKNLSVIGLNTNNLGTQYIKLSVSDRSGNINTLELNAIVEENEAPNILLSDSEITLDITKFKEYDVEFFKQFIIEADDNFTKNLDVIIDISTLKERVSDYVITYSATDEHGNSCKEMMSVKLREFVGPTLLGEDIIYVDLNEEIDLLSLVEVVDLYDERAYLRLEIIENSLDISKDGIYIVKYQCFNNSGKCSEKIVTIVVGEGELNSNSNNDSSFIEKIDIKIILIVIFAVSTTTLLVIILVRKKHK